jgi:PPM family protein phosphatase
MSDVVLADTTDFPDHPEDHLPVMPQPLSWGVRVESAAASHRGLIRPENEDHFLIADAGRFFRSRLTNLPRGSVPENYEEVVHAIGVADGMGGQAAGEIASRLALMVMVNLVLDTPVWIFSREEEHVQAVIEQTAKRFRLVNAALLASGNKDPRLFKMGTTLTVVRSLGTDLIVAHVGDSRAYLFRDGKLQRLTRDHTLAQELREANMISGMEVIANRFRHLLTQSLGTDEVDIVPQIRRETLIDGDRLLLCTDGLTDQVPENVLAEEIGGSASPQAKCDALVHKALSAGGKDNVTVAIAEYRISRGG